MEVTDVSKMGCWVWQNQSKMISVLMVILAQKVAQFIQKSFVSTFLGHIFCSVLSASFLLNVIVFFPHFCMFPLSLFTIRASDPVILSVTVNNNRLRVCVVVCLCVSKLSILDSKLQPHRASSRHFLPVSFISLCGLSLQAAPCFLHLRIHKHGHTQRMSVTTQSFFPAYLHM